MDLQSYVTEMKGNRSLTGVRSMSLGTVQPVVSQQGHHSVPERTDLVRDLKRDKFPNPASAAVCPGGNFWQINSIPAL